MTVDPEHDSPAYRRWKSISAVVLLVKFFPYLVFLSVFFVAYQFNFLEINQELRDIYRQHLSVFGINVFNLLVIPIVTPFLVYLLIVLSNPIPKRWRQAFSDGGQGYDEDFFRKDKKIQEAIRSSWSQAVAVRTNHYLWGHLKRLLVDTVILLMSLGVVVLAINLQDRVDDGEFAFWSAMMLPPLLILIRILTQDPMVLRKDARQSLGLLMDQIEREKVDRATVLPRDREVIDWLNTYWSGSFLDNKIKNCLGIGLEMDDHRCLIYLQRDEFGLKYYLLVPAWLETTPDFGAMSDDLLILGRLHLGEGEGTTLNKVRFQREGLVLCEEEYVFLSSHLDEDFFFDSNKCLRVLHQLIKVVERVESGYYGSEKLIGYYAAERLEAEKGRGSRI